MTKLSEPKTQATQYSEVAFSPLEGEKPRSMTSLTSKELTNLGDMKTRIEVVYGKTTLPLKDLAGLKEGDLLALDDLCDDLVDIYANGKHIGRGEIVAIDGQFGVKIVTLAT